VTVENLSLSYDGILQLMPFAEDNVIAVDTESGETKGMLGISIAFRTPLGVFAEYLPVKHEPEEKNLNEDQIKELFRIFAESTLVFHNAAYDLGVLEFNGYFHVGRYYDTMLMEHWLDENITRYGSYSLDACSRRHGGEPKNRPQAMQTVIDQAGWDYVPLDLMTIYSANDAEITFELFEKLLPQFRKEGFDTDLWHVHECRFINVMRRMVALGIRVDPNFCVREIARGDSIMLECLRRIGFNPGKRNELEKLLFEEFKLPVLKRSEKTGKPSITKAIMEEYDKEFQKMDDPRAKHVLIWRGWQKTISANYRAYLTLMDANNILHSNYKLHGTVTGRMSSEKPALQQIPRETENDWNGSLKKAFIPRDGFRLWEADYSQLEFRLAAAYAEDEELIGIFAEDGRDLFSEMSANLGWPRYRVKTLSYATLYGGGATHLAEVFGISVQEARRLIDDYFAAYPKLRGVIKRAEVIAKRRGYSLLWTGRRRHFQFPREESHKAFNAIIQGGAFEIVKRRMNALAEEVTDENCRMVLQVHDSVALEIADGMEDHYLPRAKECMENVKQDFDFGVRFKVDIKEWAH